MEDLKNSMLCPWGDLYIPIEELIDMIHCKGSWMK